MSKWCETCHRNELAGEWQPCSEDCPVFGKDFNELAKIVVSMKGIKIRAKCKHMREDGICLKGASSTGVCHEHCSHFEREVR